LRWSGGWTASSPSTPRSIRRCCAGARTTRAPDEALERIAAGATLVQVYTAFVYGGPLWPSRMNRGLSKLVREGGLSSVQEAIGTGVR
jgi:dihydroorotate dehydrogenase